MPTGCPSSWYSLRFFFVGITQFLLYEVNRQTRENLHLAILILTERQTKSSEKLQVS